MTPVHALQEARLERACDLLEHTTTPISDIARLCGVESEGHLKVLFRRRGRRIRASVQKAESRRKSAMGRWRMPFREKSISSMDRTNLG